MKVRWTQTSVRFRISPSELEALQRGTLVTATLRLPGGAWIATVIPTIDVTGIYMDGYALQMTLSEQDRAKLAQPDTEGVYFSTDDPEPFRYFIEKDFPCVHPRASKALEPVSETFDAPTGFEDRKSEM